MEIYLIRHTTPSAPKGIIYGYTDIPLSGTFNYEKKIVLSNLPLTLEAVYSSPSVRCSSLARHISQQVFFDERLREVDFGLWEGKTWDSIKPEELNPWMEDFVNCCPPGGESMVQMNQRVMDFWNELRLQPYKDVAIVTHAGVIRLIMATMNRIPLESVFNIEVGYGEVFRLSCL